MADYCGYKVTQTGTAALTVDTATIELQVRDSQTNALLFDFTGANALHWPASLTALTAAQKLAALAEMVPILLRIRLGG